MTSDLLERDAAKPKQSRSSQPPKGGTLATGLVVVKAGPLAHLNLVTPHALEVAQALGKRVRVVEVLQNDSNQSIPVDPIDWDLRKRQAQLRLEEFIKQFDEAACEVDFRVVDNCTMSLTRGSTDALDMPVLCFVRSGKELPWDHNETTRQLMQSGCHSVLLIPDTLSASYPATYRRIAVTLDGSSRAEGVMPTAIALARRHGAELLVLHAVPDPGLTQTGPLETEALELCERLTERNRRIAQDYLASIRTRYEADIESLVTRLLEGGDVKHQLVDSARNESVDLLLFASHGSTGHIDVPQGSVALFLLEHSTVPMMMVGGEPSEPQTDGLANTDLTPAYRSVMTPG